MRSSKLDYPVPAVVRVSFYVKHADRKLPCSRRFVMIRDEFSCQWVPPLNGKAGVSDASAPTLLASFPAAPCTSEKRFMLSQSRESPDALPGILRKVADVPPRG